MFKHGWFHDKTCIQYTSGSHATNCQDPANLAKDSMYHYPFTVGSCSFQKGYNCTKQLDIACNSFQKSVYGHAFYISMSTIYHHSFTGDKNNITAKYVKTAHYEASNINKATASYI